MNKEVLLKEIKKFVDLILILISLESLELDLKMLLQHLIENTWE